MEFDKMVKETEKRNEKFLDIFEKELKESGLSKKTIYGHLSNVSLFINDYLPYYQENIKMEEAMGYVDDFLGYFFIHKCMWATPSSLKATAASIKKFYKCMASNKLVDEDDYKYLCDEIKENMDAYLQDLYEFDHFDEYESVYSF